MSDLSASDLTELTVSITDEFSVPELPGDDVFGTYGDAVNTAAVTLGVGARFTVEKVNVVAAVEALIPDGAPVVTPPVGASSNTTYEPGDSPSDVFPSSPTPDEVPVAADGQGSPVDPGVVDETLPSTDPDTGVLVEPTADTDVPAGGDSTVPTTDAPSTDLGTDPAPVDVDADVPAEPVDGEPSVPSDTVAGTDTDGGLVGDASGVEVPADPAAADGGGDATAGVDGGDGLSDIAAPVVDDGVTSITADSTSVAPVADPTPVADPEPWVDPAPLEALGSSVLSTPTVPPTDTSADATSPTENQPPVDQ